MFVENVFAQTEGEEVKLCGNQLASRVIQDLLPESSHQVKMRFMRALSEDLRVTAVDPFASHILECLLTMAVFTGTKVTLGFQQFCKHRLLMQSIKLI